MLYALSVKREFRNYPSWLVTRRFCVTRGELELLYSWRFSRYSVSFNWLVHGHMTSNNETVSRQMPWAGNIAKAMTSNGKQFGLETLRFSGNKIHCSPRYSWFCHPILRDFETQVFQMIRVMWSLYEIIHICTAVVDESEEWSFGHLDEKKWNSSNFPRWTV